jgi:hypothetical protein
LDNYDALVQGLNSAGKEQRLTALRDIKNLLDQGLLKTTEADVVTNNHIHTRYSFSPYSPAKAAWMGYASGLATAGIMDHDTISGAGEFIEAGEILGIPTTIGFEVRTDWSATPLKGRRINNPDQAGSAYVSAHGVPHQQIDGADAFLENIRTTRNGRNRVMTANINAITAPYGIGIDYDRDILPLSYAGQGGSVTERHLLFTLAHKIIDAVGRGERLVSFLEQTLKMALSQKQKKYMLDVACDIYEYDLLNILKGAFVKRIYVDTSPEETPPVREVVGFIKSIGAIPSYCYLGDVGASPTGDKAAQKFEDDYLEEVFDTCADIGFDAIAFMPSRNTPAQLARVMALCREYGFMQVSGEDINQPRQSFVCGQLKQPAYRHLIDTTWALIGHEKAATADIAKGIFYGGRPEKGELDRIVAEYKEIGKEGR